MQVRWPDLFVPEDSVKIKFVPSKADPTFGELVWSFDVLWELHCSGGGGACKASIDLVAGRPPAEGYFGGNGYNFDPKDYNVSCRAPCEHFKNGVIHTDFLLRYQNGIVRLGRDEFAHFNDKPGEEFFLSHTCSGRSRAARITIVATNGKVDLSQSKLP